MSDHHLQKVILIRKALMKNERCGNKSSSEALKDLISKHEYVRGDTSG